MILRNLDTVTLTEALAGATGEVARAFLANLLDGLPYLIYEDMKQWNRAGEGILAAQKKMLEMGSLRPNIVAIYKIGQNSYNYSKRHNKFLFPALQKPYM